MIFFLFIYLKIFLFCEICLETTVSGRCTFNRIPIEILSEMAFWLKTSWDEMIDMKRAKMSNLAPRLNLLLRFHLIGLRHACQPILSSPSSHLFVSSSLVLLKANDKLIIIANIKGLKKKWMLVSFNVGDHKIYWYRKMELASWDQIPARAVCSLTDWF